MIDISPRKEEWKWQTKLSYKLRYFKSYKWNIWCNDKKGKKMEVLFSSSFIKRNKDFSTSSARAAKKVGLVGRMPPFDDYTWKGGVCPARMKENSIP